MNTNSPERAALLNEARALVLQMTDEQAEKALLLTVPHLLISINRKLDAITSQLQNQHIRHRM